MDSIAFMMGITIKMAAMTESYGYTFCVLQTFEPSSLRLFGEMNGSSTPSGAKLERGILHQMQWSSSRQSHVSDPIPSMISSLFFHLSICVRDSL